MWWVQTRKTIDARSCASDNYRNIKSWADAHTNLPRLDMQGPGQGGPAMWPLACKPVATKPAPCVNPSLECSSRTSQVRVFYCPKSDAQLS